MFEPIFDKIRNDAFSSAILIKTWQASQATIKTRITPDTSRHLSPPTNKFVLIFSTSPKITAPSNARRDIFAHFCAKVASDPVERRRSHDAPLRITSSSYPSRNSCHNHKSASRAHPAGKIDVWVGSRRKIMVIVPGTKAAGGGRNNERLFVLLTRKSIRLWVTWLRIQMAEMWLSTCLRAVIGYLC